MKFNTLMREDKVRILKKKILAQIKNELEFVKEQLKGDIMSFDVLVKRGFALLNLKEYILDEHAFMDYVAKYTDIDTIIYKVSDEHLNVWLQDDYDFAWNFLCQAARCQYNVFNMLNDEYFAHGFTNIYDFIFYDEEINE